MTHLDTRPPGSVHPHAGQQPSTPPSRQRRAPWASVLLTLPFLAVGTATLLAGAVPSAQPASTPLTKFASFIDWGPVAWAAAALITALSLLVTRRAGVAALFAVSLLGLGIQASWVAPYFTAESQPMVAGQTLRVATLNMEFGSADRGQILQLAQNSDVLVLVEITPEAIDSLRAAGLEETMPHRLGDGMAYASGTAIYSRTAVQPVADLGTSMESMMGRVSTADGTEVLVAAVHPVNPNSGGRGWAADAGRLREGLRPHLDENLVVTGDFNAVRGHLTMDDLADDGLSDAADLAGAGLPRTWPMRGLPFPVIAIDHTLVSPTLTARDLSVQHVANTDHSGLLVTVGVARE